jgi:hypothetical protein
LGYITIGYCVTDVYNALYLLENPQYRKDNLNQKAFVALWPLATLDGVAGGGGVGTRG